jgi:hypothetical protein
VEKLARVSHETASSWRLVRTAVACHGRGSVVSKFSIAPRRNQPVLAGEFKKHFSASAWLIVTNLALTTAAAAAPASTIPVNSFGPWYPWENTALNNCNGEDISVAGKHREETTLVEDAQGGFHVLMIVRTITTGVGLISGARYVTDEGWTLTQNVPAGGALTSTLPIVGTLISLNKSAPDLHYRIFLRTTVDAKGNVRVDFSQI